MFHAYIIQLRKDSFVGTFMCTVVSKINYLYFVCKSTVLKRKKDETYYLFHFVNVLPVKRVF